MHNKERQFRPMNTSGMLTSSMPQDLRRLTVTRHRITAQIGQQVHSPRQDRQIREKRLHSEHTLRRETAQAALFAWCLPVEIHTEKHSDFGAEFYHRKVDRLLFQEKHTL